MVVRRIWVDAATGDYGREALKFPGLRAILRVDGATIHHDGEETTETRYFAASLDPARVSATRLLAIVRGHWQIENSLHFVKDRWWDEDRHMCRRGGLAAGFTSLMTAAITALRATNPGGAGVPLRAQADALNWNIGAAINLMVRTTSCLCYRPAIDPRHRSRGFIAQGTDWRERKGLRGTF